jgi:hypothetical protein
VLSQSLQRPATSDPERGYLQAGGTTSNVTGSAAATVAIKRCASASASACVGATPPRKTSWVPQRSRMATSARYRPSARRATLGVSAVWPGPDMASPVNARLPRPQPNEEGWNHER